MWQWSGIFRHSPMRRGKGRAGSKGFAHLYAIHFAFIHRWHLLAQIRREFVRWRESRERREGKNQKKGQLSMEYTGTD